MGLEKANVIFDVLSGKVTPPGSGLVFDLPLRSLRLGLEKHVQHCPMLQCRISLDMSLLCDKGFMDRYGSYLVHI